jgi:hypothetical protein
VLEQNNAKQELLQFAMVVHLLLKKEYKNKKKNYRCLEFAIWL